MARAAPLAACATGLALLLAAGPVRASHRTYIGVPNFGYVITSGVASGYEFDSRSGSGDNYLWYDNGGVATLYDITRGVAVLTMSGTGLLTSLGETSFSQAEDHATAPATASFTFDATMQMRVADATSGAVVGTLPPCASSINGRDYVLVKADSSVNSVSFAPNGTDKIVGSNASLSVGTTQGSATTLRCNGNGSGVTAGWWKH